MEQTFKSIEHSDLVMENTQEIFISFLLPKTELSLPLWDLSFLYVPTHSPAIVYLIGVFSQNLPGQAGSVETWVLLLVPASEKPLNFLKTQFLHVFILW